MLQVSSKLAASYTRPPAPAPRRARADAATRRPVSPRASPPPDPQLTKSGAETPQDGRETTLIQVTRHTAPTAYYGLRLTFGVINTDTVVASRTEFLLTTVHTVNTTTKYYYYFLRAAIQQPMLHVSSHISCGCCVTYVSLFINLRHPRDFTSHTSRRVTLCIVFSSSVIHFGTAPVFCKKKELFCFGYLLYSITFRRRINSYPVYSLGSMRPLSCGTKSHPYLSLSLFSQCRSSFIS